MILWWSFDAGHRLHSGHESCNEGQPSVVLSLQTAKCILPDTIRYNTIDDTPSPSTTCIRVRVETAACSLASVFFYCCIIFFSFKLALQGTNNT